MRTHPTQYCRSLIPVLLATGLTLALLLVIGSLPGMVASVQAGTGSDPYLTYITATADIPLYDPAAGDGITKTVYFDNQAGSGTITLTFEITGTTPFTLTSGAAFDRPDQVLTGTVSPWQPVITYSVNSYGSQPAVPYTASNALLDATVAVTFTQDLAAPINPAVEIQGGAPVVSDTLVDLQLSAEDAASGVSEIRLRNDELAWDAWQPYATTPSWSLQDLDGERVVWAEFRDRLGHISAAVSDTIVLDQAGPGDASILIDGDAPYAIQQAVTLTLSATDATEMRLHSDSDSWDAWQAYTETLSWILPDPDGEHSVWVEFRDEALNVSPAVSDTIVLDRQSPTGPVVLINGGAQTSTHETVNLVITSDDATSGVSHMRLQNDDQEWTDWLTFSSPISWTLQLVDGLRTVYVQTRDAAGNLSAENSDSITLDRAGPINPQVTIDGDATYALTRTVSLELDATDLTGSVSDMRLRNDADSWSEWQSYATTLSWELADLDGLRSVSAEYRDDAGNVSNTVSDTITLDRLPPTDTNVNINEGDAYVDQLNVTLTLAAEDATSGVSQMRFSNDGANWGSWQTSAITAPWTLVGPDGLRTVWVEFRDAAGNTAAPVTDTITLDREGPTGVSILIDDGATYATQLAVTLTLTATDAIGPVFEMQFSTDGSNWLSWEPFATERAWTLTDEDGLQTVYARFRDAAGNESTIVNDTIVLDRQPPANGDLSINEDQPYTSLPGVSLDLSAEDALSGVDQMRLSNDGAAWQPWETYAVTRTWTLESASDGTKTVYAEFQDGAGNVTSPITDSIVLDRQPPSGSLVIDSGATYANQITVTLSLAAADATSGMGDMRFSNDGADWSPWEAYATGDQWLLDGAADGVKTVFAQFRDLAGNASSSVTDTIILDRTPPGAPAISINGGEPYTTDPNVTLTLAAEDATEMRLSHDTETWTEWEAFAASRAWTIDSGSDGSKVVYAQFRDAAQNPSEIVQDSIVLDRAAPVNGSIVIENDQEYTNLLNVELALSAEDAVGVVAGMQFSNDGLTWADWTSYSLTTTWTLSGTLDGLRTVWVQFRDSVGNVSDTYSDTIIVDRQPPTEISILINDNDPYTVLPEVTLTLAAQDTGSGVTDMSFSNNGIDWSEWETYTAERAWTLSSATDGTKSTFVRFRDLAGNVSTSASDTIMLDRQPPTNSTVQINDDAPYTGAVTVTLAMSAEDPVSGLALARFSNDGTNWESWQAWVLTRTWELEGAADGLQTVYAEYQDAAGNVAAVVSDTIVLDRVAPINPGVVINDGALFSAQVGVTLTLAAEDATSTVADMRFANQDGAWDDWTTFVPGFAWNLDGSSDGERTVQAQFRDGAGNQSLVVSDAIVLDRLPPAGITISSPSQTAETSFMVQWSAMDALSDEYYDIQYRVNDGAWQGWFTATTTTRATFALAELGNLYHFRVTASDAAGNESTPAATTTLVDLYRIYLPIALKNHHSGPILIGGFESGYDGWVLESAPLPLSRVSGVAERPSGSTAPPEGTHALLLGYPNYPCAEDGVPVGYAGIHHLVEIPVNASSLTFNYVIWSQDSSPDLGYDAFEVLVNEQVRYFDGNYPTGQLSCSSWWRVPSLENPRDGVTSGWAEGELDLSPYRGMTVTIAFRNQSRVDGWYNTYTYLDNIQVQTNN